MRRGSRARHGVVLFADTKAMEMKVRPVKANLQDGVKIGVWDWVEQQPWWTRL